jgi:hypothetical protein
VDGKTGEQFIYRVATAPPFPFAAMAIKADFAIASTV